MKNFFLTILCFCLFSHLTSFGQSNVLADPSLEGMSITTLADAPISILIPGTSYKLKVQLKIANSAGAIPRKNLIVAIALGGKLDLDPNMSYDFSSAGLNTIFDYIPEVNGTNTVVYMDQVGTVPAGTTTAEIILIVKAKGSGDATTFANILIPNDNPSYDPPGVIINEQNPSNNSSQTNYTVNACNNPPNISTGSYGPVCEEAPNVPLIGTPTGGVWTGIGVSENIMNGFVFDPSVGTQLLTYTVTSSNGCTNSAQTTITVIDDTTSPDIMGCPVDNDNDPLTLPIITATAGANCKATVPIPVITFSDNCTPNANIVIAWEIFLPLPATSVTGTGPLTTYDFPVGTSEVLITYEDASGNSTACNFEVVVSKITPTFTQILPICKGSSLAALPTTSNNGVAGSWSPVVNNMATTTYTFTPTNTACANGTTMEIVVNQLPVVTAGTYGPVCFDAADIALIGSPAGGTWTGTGVSGSGGAYVFDPNAGTQTLTYTFTDANSCSSASTTTITVNQKPASVITNVTICAGQTYTWSVNNLTYSASTQQTVQNTGCVADQILNLTIVPNITPTFTQVSPICIGDNLSALPTTSNNGIVGSWSPAINNMATTVYTFTPNIIQNIQVYKTNLTGSAEAPPNASPATGEVIVTVDLIAKTMRVQSIFSGLTGNTTAAHIHGPTVAANTGTAGVATTTPNFTFFPLGVTNGTYDNTFDMTLTGSYNASFITANGGTPASAFTALASALNNNKAYFNLHSTAFPGGEIRGFLSPQANCVTSATMEIVVNQKVTPTFTQIAPICAGASLAALPTSSTNMITGTWSPTLNNLATTIYTFTPTAGQCANSTTMEIVVNQKPDIAAVGPTGDVCPGSTIIFDVTNPNMVGGTFNWSAKDANNLPIGSGTGVAYGLGAISINPNIVCPNKAEITFTFTPAGPAPTLCEGTPINKVVNVRDEAKPVVVGTLKDLEKEGCSATDAPAPYTTVAQLEANLIGLSTGISDNCTADLDLVVTYDEVNDEQTCVLTITRTYTITDKCLNKTDLIQKIKIKDTTAPTLKMGSVIPTGTTNMNICFSAIPAGPTEADIAALFEDNCGALIIVKKSGIPSGTDCDWSVTYSYTVKDACENTYGTPILVTYNGSDQSAPTWTTIAGSLDKSVECSNTNGLAAAQALFPVAMDNCDTDVTNIVKVTGLFVPTNNICTNTGTYTNTWSVTDACGKISEIFTQIITITDKTPPTITLPNPFISSAPAPVILNDDYSFNTPSSSCVLNVVFNKPILGDNCTAVNNLSVIVSAKDKDGGIISIMNQGSTYSADFPLGKSTVTFSTTDNCGNSAIKVITITIIDNVKPKKPTLPNIVACGAVAKPTTNDNCDILITGTTTDPTEYYKVGSYTITWLFTDASGNTETATQMVTVIGSGVVAGSVVKDNTASNNIVDGAIQPGVVAFVSLVKGSTIVATVPVSMGLYTLPDVCEGTYKVILHTTPAGSLVPQLPTGYGGFGSEGSLNGAADITPNGIASVTISSGALIYNNARVAAGGNLSFGLLPMALPVRLIAFKGKSTEKGNELTWKTNSESNFSHYEVEKSTTAKEFKLIGKVNGASSNTNETVLYNFLDENQGSGMVPGATSVLLINPATYYRLKMVDLDGSSEYSKVLFIENEESKSTVGDFYPNPAFGNEVSISITCGSSKLWTITSYDLSGRVLNIENRELVKGENILKFDGNKYKSAISIYRFESVDGVQFRKLSR